MTRYERSLEDTILSTTTTTTTTIVSVFNVFLTRYWGL